VRPISIVLIAGALWLLSLAHSSSFSLRKSESAFQGGCASLASAN
jgi:hypothetical protein